MTSLDLTPVDPTDLGGNGGGGGSSGGPWQPLDSELGALAGLNSVADTVPYFTGPGTAALTGLSAYARTLLDDTSSAAALTTLGITATQTEINYLGGVTGPIQGQLDALEGAGGGGAVTDFQALLATDGSDTHVYLTSDPGEDIDTDLYLSSDGHITAHNLTVRLRTTHHYGNNPEYDYPVGTPFLRVSDYGNFYAGENPWVGENSDGGVRQMNRDRTGVTTESPFSPDFAIDNHANSLYGGRRFFFGDTDDPTDLVSQRADSPQATVASGSLASPIAVGCVPVDIPMVTLGTSASLSAWGTRGKVGMQRHAPLPFNPANKAFEKIQDNRATYTGLDFTPGAHKLLGVVGGVFTVLQAVTLNTTTPTDVIVAEPPFRTRSTQGEQIVPGSNARFTRTGFGPTTFSGQPAKKLVGCKARSTYVTTATGVNATNSPTLNVASTAGFPSSGTLVLAGTGTPFAYTGKTTTSFTGCGNHAATVGGESVGDAVTISLAASDTFNVYFEFGAGATFRPSMAPNPPLAAPGERPHWWTNSVGGLGRYAWRGPALPPGGVPGNDAAVGWSAYVATIGGEATEDAFTNSASGRLKFSTNPYGGTGALTRVYVMPLGQLNALNGVAFGAATELTAGTNQGSATPSLGQSGQYAYTNVAQAEYHILQGAALTITIATNQAGDDTHNEVQQIDVAGGVDGDLYTLTLFGEETDPIGYDTNLAVLNNPAAAMAVQSALEELDSVEPGDLKVTRTIVGGITQRFIVTFGQTLTGSHSRYKITNTAATSITNLLITSDAAIDGQLLILRSSNTNTTLRHNVAGAGKIWLKDAADRQMLTNETIFLMYDQPSATFYEVASKPRLAGLTASRAMVTDTAGVGTTSAVTATELGYVAGVTSGIQAQLNSKQASGSYQTLDTELTALASTTSAANMVPYYTGSGTATTTSLSAYGRTLIDDADAATARATLGITATATEIGYLSGATSNIQAQINSLSSGGVSDPELLAIAGLTSAADTFPYFTGSGTAALTGIKAGPRSMLTLSSAAADKIPYYTGSTTSAMTGFTLAARNLLDDPDATTMRATLGITATATEIGYLSGVTSGIQTQINTVSNSVALTPETYGAAGNGTTDDTAALTAWLAATGRKAATPAKTYLVSGTLTLAATDDIDFVGSTVKAKNSSSPKLLVTGNNVTLRNLKFDGNRAGTSVTSQGVEWRGTGGKLVNVESSHHASNSGVWTTTNGAQIDCFNCRADDNGTLDGVNHGNNYGFGVASGTGRLRLYGCEANTNGYAGAYLNKDAADGCVIDIEGDSNVVCADLRSNRGRAHRISATGTGGRFACILGTDDNAGTYLTGSHWIIDRVEGFDLDVGGGQGEILRMHGAKYNKIRSVYGHRNESYVVVLGFGPTVDGTGSCDFNDFGEIVGQQTDNPVLTMEAALNNTFGRVSGLLGSSVVVNFNEGFSGIANKNIIGLVQAEKMPYGAVVFASGAGAEAQHNEITAVHAVDSGTATGQSIVSFDSTADNNRVGRVSSKSPGGTKPDFIVVGATGSSGNVVVSVQGEYNTALKIDSGSNAFGLAGSKATVTDADGQLATSSVTATQLGYLGGATPVTSSVQAQINALAGGGGGGIPPPTGTPATDDVLQYKSGAWTNRTIAQLGADITAANIFQPKNANLTSLAGLAGASNTIPYFSTGSGAMADTQLSGGGASILGMVGSSQGAVYFSSANVASTYNTTNAGRALAGLAGAADKIPYYTSSSAVATADFPAAMRTFLTTSSSANLAALLTDETGSGANVHATSPTLVTPVLGTPASGTLTNATGLPISTGVSGLATGAATFLATPSSANLASLLTDETGSGAAVFATSPTLVTPILGTPTSGTLTNATGLPLAGLTGGANDDVAQRKAGAWTNRTMPQLAADLGATPGGITVVRKTADQTVNNSATIVDDTHLQFAVAANDIYFLQVFLLINSASANSDFKMSWAVPSGTTAVWGELAPIAAGTWAALGAGSTPGQLRAVGGNPTYGSPTAAGMWGIQLQGWFTVSSTAGTIKLRWAQGTATAEDTTVLTNSFLRIQKLA